MSAVRIFRPNLVYCHHCHSKKDATVLHVQENLRECLRCHSKVPRIPFWDATMSTPMCESPTLAVNFTPLQYICTWKELRECNPAYLPFSTQPHDAYSEQEPEIFMPL